MSYEQEIIISVAAPIMGGAGTTAVANITSTGADLTGTYTSDGGSPITATGFVVYPAGNPSTVIGGLNVLQFPDGILPSPITATASGLTSNTNYCFKPYATNAIGTSYGVEVCFTTEGFIYGIDGASNTVWKINETTGGLISSISITGAGNTLHTDGTYIFGVSNTHINKIDRTTGTLTATYAISGATVQVFGGLYYDNNHYITYNGGGVARVNSTLTSNTNVALPFGSVYICRLGSLLFISNSTSNNFSIVETSPFSLITNIPFGAATYGICTDGTYIYVCGGGNIKKYDSTGTFIAGNTNANWQNDMQYHDGFLYCTNYGGGALCKVDPATITNALPPLSITNAGNITIGGQYLYTSNYGSNSYTKVNLLTWSVVGGYPGYTNIEDILIF